MKTRSDFRAHLPWHLTTIRLLLSPVALAFAWWHLLGWPYVLLLVAAFATDYFDGMLARRYGVVGSGLRLYDSVTDTVFYLAVLGGMWIAYPELVVSYFWGIGGIIGLEIVRYIVDLAKFGRGASYHAYSAKAFGVFLFVACVAIMGFGVSTPFMEIALLLGIVSELEGLVMSIVLSEWTHDVRHIGIAVALRRSSNVGVH